MKTETREVDFKVDLANGKYTYIRYKNSPQAALRYGEEWRERDLIGDNLIYYMGCKIEELQNALFSQPVADEELRKAVEQLEHRMSVGNCYTLIGEDYKALKTLLRAVKQVSPDSKQRPCKCCKKPCYQEICHECKQLMAKSVDDAVKQGGKCD